MKKQTVTGIIVLVVLIAVITGVTLIQSFSPSVETKFSVSSYDNKGRVSSTYYSSEDADKVKEYKKQFIGAIYIEGTIQESNSDYDQQWLLSTIKSLKENENNAALALFINSPGGAVYQADEVFFALQDYKTTGKPIYVYQGPMSASGGYYISCAGNKIYANRNTLTGCIGVIMGTSYDLTGLFENIGIESITIHSGRNKNMMNYNEPFNEEQQAIMQSICDECYEQFVSIVANRRNMSYEQACELSDGRLYTAKQALENGLIDGIDTWENMLQTLADKELNKPGIKVVTYRKEKKTNWVDLLYGKAKEIATAKTAATLGLPSAVVEDMNNSSMIPMYLYK